MIRTLVLIAACVGASPRAVGQNAPPQQVAESIWAGVQAGTWDRVARFMHPVALHELRLLLDPLVMTTGAAGDSVRQVIFGSVSRDIAASASDSAVYVNLMRFGASIKGSQPGAVEAADYQFLGMVSEGKDTVHVIGRASATMSGRPLSWIQVTSLMRLGSTWRGLLEPNWSQYAWALRAAMAPKR